MSSEFEILEMLYEEICSIQKNLNIEFSLVCKSVLDMSLYQEFITSKIENDKYPYKNPLSNSFYLQFLKGKDTLLEREEKGFEKNLDIKKKKLEKLFEKYEQTYLKFKNESTNHKLQKLDLKTVQSMISIIDELNEKQKSNILSLNLLNHNNYYMLKKEFSKFHLEILEAAKNIVLIVKNSHNYISSIELSMLDNIDQKDLKKGDIIIEQIKKSYPSIKGKAISFFLNSPIIHVSLLYEMNEYGMFVFEATTAGKNIDSKISRLKIDENIEYIVVRHKKRLTREQLEILEDFIEDHISKPYSRLKTLGIVYHNTRFFLSDKLKIPLSRSKNPFGFSKGVFCSELIAKAYEEMGIRISILGDNSMVFPADIINSKDFAIVGKLN